MPIEIVQKRDNWKKRMKPDPADGVLVWILKAILYGPARAWFELVFLQAMKVVSGSLRKLSILSSYDEKLIWYLSIDAYKLIMTLLLTASVFASVWGSDSTAALRFGVFFILILFVTGRLIELFSVSIMLTNDKGYSPKSGFRTLANTAWHYGEIILAFSVLYIIVSALDPEAIVRDQVALASDSSKTTANRVTEAIYFSTVTITTLGYGDFVPVSTLARILVVSQLGLGLFLILLTLPSFLSHYIESRSTDEEWRLETENLAPWVEGLTGVMGRRKLDNQETVHVTAGAVALASVKGNGGVLMVRKAPKAGYEYGGKWALPGGMLELSDGISKDTLFRSLEMQLVNRLYREASVSCRERDLTHVGLGYPTVSKFTRDGETTYCFVMAYKVNAAQTHVSFQPVGGSVDESRVFQLNHIPWKEVAPANRLILASLLWPSMEDQQKEIALPEIKAAIEQCNGWANELKVNKFKPWFDI